MALNMKIRAALLVLCVIGGIALLAGGSPVAGVIVLICGAINAFFLLTGYRGAVDMARGRRLPEEQRFN